MANFFQRYFDRPKGNDNARLQAHSRLSFAQSQFDALLYKLALEEGLTGEKAFMQFLERSVSRSFDQPVLLSEELSLLHAYMDIFQQAKKGTISLRENVPVMDTDFIVEPFITFPLVQNALHSLYFNSDRKPLRLKIALVRHTLQLEVSNQINPYLADQRQAECMLLFEDRLRYSYIDRHDLFVNSNSNTFKATLHLQMR